MTDDAAAAAPAPRDSGDVELLALIDRLAGLLERSDLAELEVESGGTAVILRASVAGSRPFMNRLTAAIDEYSQPWIPPSSARCGPSAAPSATKAGCSTQRR